MSLSAPNAEVDICNFALDHLKQAAIVQIDPPTTNAEQICARNYPQQRRSALRLHPWNFALKRGVLMPDSSATPAFGYSHAYNLPNDFIRFCGIVDSSGSSILNVDYDLESNQLLYNGEDNSAVYIKYVYDMKNVIRFDPLFIDVLSVKLAIAIAPKFTATETRITSLKEILKEVLGEARAIDGQERPPRRVERSKWRESRTNGRSSRTSAGPYTIFS